MESQKTRLDLLSETSKSEIEIGEEWQKVKREKVVARGNQLFS